jgi:hypothetical protein
MLVGQFPSPVPQRMILPIINTNTQYNANIVQIQANIKVETILDSVHPLS